MSIALLRPVGAPVCRLAVAATAVACKYYIEAYRNAQDVDGNRTSPAIRCFIGADSHLHQYFGLISTIRARSIDQSILVKFYWMCCLDDCNMAVLSVATPTDGNMSIDGVHSSTSLQRPRWGIQRGYHGSTVTVAADGSTPASASRCTGSTNIKMPHIEPQLNSKDETLVRLFMASCYHKWDLLHGELFVA